MTNGYIVESPQQDYLTSAIVEQQEQAVGVAPAGLGLGFALPTGAPAPNIVGGRVS